MDVVTLGLAKNYTNTKTGDLSTLTTTEKTNIVGSVNELNSIKAEKAQSPTEGHIATLDTDGNPVDGGTALSSINSQLAEITPNHNYEFSGRDLSTIFADAAALHTAVAAGDFSKIRIGDFWPVTLNGNFYDFSSYTAPSGTEYFSDTGLTTSAGTLSAAKEITYVNETYCTFKISDVSYYVATSACLTYFEKTLSNATLKYEVCPQTYIRYSDTSVPNHLLMVPRDCLPLYLKMRKTNADWTNTTATNPWLGSALYKTLNDPDHGIIALLAATDIGQYIYTGPNGKGMRYLGETKAAGASTATSWGWLDRGKLFLPLEREVWGQDIFSEHTNGAGVALQWPIFTGTLKHISKGVGDGASRNYWWCASSYAGSAASFAVVGGYGFPYINGASTALGVPPCFLFT
jgi:hypothetical protein